MSDDVGEAARRRRWRLALGPGGGETAPTDAFEELADRRLDAALADLYPSAPTRRARSAKSALSAARRIALALDELRAVAPPDIVDEARRDAARRIDWPAVLRAMAASEPVDALGAGAGLAPDLTLAGDLALLAQDAAPEVKTAARRCIVRAVDAALASLSPIARAAAAMGASPVSSARHRGGRVDLGRSVAAALARGGATIGPNGDPVLVIERFLAKPRRPRPKELILLLDQSGSMRASIGPAAVAAASLAALPGVGTRLFAFDHRLVDLSDRISDPVECLFGAMLGGGTDIAGALDAAGRALDRPDRSVVVLISDVGDGSGREAIAAAARRLLAAGVDLRVALAIGAEGAMRYDRKMAEQLRAMGAPCAVEPLDAFVARLAAALWRVETGFW